MKEKKQFAIYTIEEKVFVKTTDGVFKTQPEKVIKIYRFLGIPIKRTFAEKIEI